MERTHYDSPLGLIRLTVDDGRLVEVRLLKRRRKPPGKPTKPSAAMRAVRMAFDGYFAGDGAALDVLEVALPKGSPFARRVYEELRRIPSGRLVSYGELAERAGSPGGARAVGQVMGRNPVPVVVPCHRVVQAGGKVGGFGAGPEWKRRLLTHEGWTVTEGGKVKGKAPRSTERVCVYAGSFDPPTEGHMFMIRKGAALFDRLVVAVGINPNKHCTFSLADRLEMLRECTLGLDNVEVDSFEGQFLVHYAHSTGAGYVLRGIRSEEDYRFEHAMRNVNEDLEPDVSTVFLVPPREICEVSSSFVKGLVGFDGWQEIVKPYVPEPVYRKLLVSEIRWHEQSAGAEGGAD